jgi:hypothetical protein
MPQEALLASGFRPFKMLADNAADWDPSTVGSIFQPF